MIAKFAKKKLSRKKWKVQSRKLILAKFGFRENLYTQNFLPLRYSWLVGFFLSVGGQVFRLLALTWRNNNCSSIGSLYVLLNPQLLTPHLFLNSGEFEKLLFVQIRHRKFHWLTKLNPRKNVSQWNIHPSAAGTDDIPFLAWWSTRDERITSCNQYLFIKNHKQKHNNSHFITQVKSQCF